MAITLQFLISGFMLMTMMPDDQALGAGLSTAGHALSPIYWGVLGKLILNPNDQRPEKAIFEGKREIRYFGPEVSKNCDTFFLVNAIVMFICALATIFLTEPITHQDKGKYNFIEHLANMINLNNYNNSSKNSSKGSINNVDKALSETDLVELATFRAGKEQALTTPLREELECSNIKYKHGEINCCDIHKNIRFESDPRFDFSTPKPKKSEDIALENLDLNWDKEESPHHENGNNEKCELEVIEEKTKSVLKSYIFYVLFILVSYILAMPAFFLINVKNFGLQNFTDSTMTKVTFYAAVVAFASRLGSGMSVDKYGTFMTLRVFILATSIMI